MQIEISIKNKVASNPTEAIVCGNSDYQILFHFDEEWNANSVKTARFVSNGAYEDKVFEGNLCDCPVFYNTTLCAVGVYEGLLEETDPESTLHTTTPALISCKKSILCEDGLPAPPSDDVYDQILGIMNKTLEVAQSVRSDADAGLLDGEQGPQGDPGYSPQKGVDYWNTEDKVEVETFVNQKVIENYSELANELDIVKDIALGAEIPTSYNSYAQMVETLNALPKDFFKSGQDINIVTVGVPDVWVAFIEDEHEPYTYVDDETIVQTISEVGTIKIGYYVLGQRETKTVRTDDLAKKEQVPKINAIQKENGAFTLTISMGVE